MFAKFLLEEWQLFLLLLYTGSMAEVEIKQNFPTQIQKIIKIIDVSFLGDDDTESLYPGLPGMETYEQKNEFTTIPQIPDNFLSEIAEFISKSDDNKSKLKPYKPKLVSPIKENKSSPELQPQVFSIAEEKVAECRALTKLVIELQRSKGVLDTEYRTQRDVLIDLCLSGSNPTIRKSATTSIVHLASNGVDPEITKVLSKIVKQMAKKSEIDPLGLDSEQAFALRTLLALNNADSNRLLLQLLEINGLDSRIKKLALRALREHRFFGTNTSIQVDVLLNTDSKNIRWQDFSSLAAIASLPSRQLREQVIRAIDRTFSDLSRKPERPADLSSKYASIPAEVFLQTYELSQITNIPLERFNELFSISEGSRTNEELTFILTSFLVEDEGQWFKGVEKPLRAGPILRAVLASSPDKQRFPLILTTLKKGLFLINQTSGDPQKYLQMCKHFYEEIESDELPQDQIDGIFQSRCLVADSNQPLVAKEIIKLVLSGRPLALQEVDRILSGEITNEFLNLFPDHHIDPSQIHNLVDVWQNLDPLFLYASKLSLYNYLETLRLLGEMVIHMDPPKMTEWKKWRYDVTNPIVEAQIGFLSDKEREAYAQDYFVDLSDVLIGVNLKERPLEIRGIIALSILGYDQDNIPLKRAPRWLREFFIKSPLDDSDFETKAREAIRTCSEDMGLLQQVVDLRKNLSVASRAGTTLGRWRRAESEKRDQLRNLGYLKAMGVDEISTEISRIRASELPSETERKVEELALSGKMGHYQKLNAHVRYLTGKERLVEESELETLRVLKEEFQDQLGEAWEKSIEAYKRITTLVGSIPKALDPLLLDFFEKHHVSPLSVQPSELESIQQQLSADLDLLESSENYVKLRTNLDLSQRATERELYQAIEDFSVSINVLQLTTLTPSLIASGRISEESSENLNVTLTKLSKSFRGCTISDEIGRIHDLVGSITPVSKQSDLCFVFTDNPLVGLTVGRYPQGAQSCQKYWFGDDTLAAFSSDALTKICLLIDKSKLPDPIVDLLNDAKSEDEKILIFNQHTNLFLEAIIARRVTKIVKQSISQAANIFLEPVYTSYDRTQITKLLNSFVRFKIQVQTNLPLLRGGGNIEVNVAKSRNVDQYEDGEFGGPHNGGIGSQRQSYTMPGQRLVDADFFHDGF